MTHQTPFAAALDLCALTQSEAAQLLGVSIDSVKDWCSAARSAKRTVPAGIWSQLRVYWRDQAAHAGRLRAAFTADRDLVDNIAARAVADKREPFGRMAIDARIVLDSDADPYGC